MDFDVTARAFVAVLVLLVAGVLMAFGAAAQLVTALSIVALALAPLVFIGLRVRPPSSTPEPPLDPRGEVLAD